MQIYQTKSKYYIIFLRENHNNKAQYENELFGNIYFIQNPIYYLMNKPILAYKIKFFSIVEVICLQEFLKYIAFHLMFKLDPDLGDFLYYKRKEVLLELLTFCEPEQNLGAHMD